MTSGSQHPGGSKHPGHSPHAGPDDGSRRERSDRGARHRGSPHRPDQPPGTDRLGRRDRRPDPAGRRRLVRRLRGGVRAPVRGARREGHLHAARPDQAPELASTPPPTPRDVARVEDRTFICSEKRGGRRPDQQLDGPRRDAGRSSAERCSAARMRGRTMYVVPFCMGPLGSPLSALGVEITDSAVRRRLDADHDPHGHRPSSTSSATTASSCTAVHTVGAPLGQGQADVPWPCNATKYISHFPETREIWSYGSGYGGNALLGKKCYALRIASVMARDEGWLAEHMLILKLTPPQGESEVRRRRLPARLRQDQPRHAAADHPRLDGRDHRRRHRLDALRRGRPALRDQPRGRLLRRRARHRRAHQRQRDRRRCAGNSRLHQRRADRRRRRVVGGHDRGAARAPDRLEGQRLDARTSDDARRPPQRPLHRARPRSARSSRPSGRTRRACRSRRSSSAAAAPRAVPLVTESFDWQHGVFLGANVASEKTAAAEGKVGELRRDPFAMLPFCGYNMGDYFAHWLDDRRAGRRRRSCRRSTTSTGSARTTTASSSGPASARTAAS